jgi:hypothetical protein
MELSSDEEEEEDEMEEDDEINREIKQTMKVVSDGGKKGAKRPRVKVVVE